MLADTALDIDQFLNTDLFQSHSPPTPSSTPSSPEQGLLTPPQQAPAPSFHDASDSLAQPYSLFDEEIKAIDVLGSSSAFDFLGAAGSSLEHTLSGYGLPMDLGYSGIPGFNMNMNMGFNLPIAPIQEDDGLQHMAIDPQLVGTPVSEDFDDEDFDDEHSSSSGTSPAAAVTAPSPTASASSSASASASSSTAPAPSAVEDEARERLTLTIAPIKVGGHGKARRGTVQSGGISKKSAVGTMSALRGDKENLIGGGAHSAALPSSSSLAASSTPASQSTATSPLTPATSATATKSLPKPPTILKASAKKGKGKDIIEEEDEDDVPQDWRPSPEVFAKMTSKEKRQLRNKISARNFRVRRKEYISTLEGDIAERDRLLEAIRSELGSTQSENHALRQEIEALKKVLLEGRGAADLPSLNLPPPAPLPVGLGAPTAATATSSAIIDDGMVPSPPGTPAPGAPHQQTNATASVSSPLSAPSASANATSSASFTPNIQKDLPSSPTPRPFWGGQHTTSSIMGGLGGGVTPVHTTLIPEINVSLWGTPQAPHSAPSGKKVLGDGMNINPLLNAIGAGFTGTKGKLLGTDVGAENMRERAAVQNHTPMLTGFDAFADTNMFTMKSLDAYRMQLWGKMAAQHHAHNALLAQQQQHPSSPFSSSSSSASSSPSPQMPFQLTGPASSLRPQYFSSPSLSPKAASASGSGLGTTLSALLSGKHSSAHSSSSSTNHGLLTPPASPRLGARGSSSSPTSTPTAQQREREREAQAAMLAAVASQTLFKKLGNAFWDAFSGSSSTSSSPTIPSSSTSATQRNWDADKVRKVLEGKAVVRVVDIDTPPSSPTPSAASVCGDMKRCAADVLEESMRSLTIGHHKSVGGAGAVSGATAAGSSSGRN
ncbi:hypothetical protein AN958_12440 [Leucoagaricus sp. SymC.cos]|nr:hypothetical protein AN958_12440 [Leucoagaricus sp. SymC.cos]